MNLNSTNNIIDKLKYQFRDEPLIILESQMDVHPSSISSFVAVRPKQWVKAKGDWIEWQINGELENFKFDPWDALAMFRKKTSCWLFGYLGYDLKNFTEKITSSNRALSDLPDLYFMEPEFLFTIDSNKINQISGKTVDFSDTELNTGNVQDLSIKNFKAAISKRDYVDKIIQIQKQINNGDYYELNFSFPKTAEFSGDPYELYRQMRQINPVPFGAFISIDNFSVCCASPERFLKKSGNRVISEPIKGTAERAAKKALDIKRKEEILNEKNRAENLMIVDLVRHDLSKIAKTGSVNVSKLYDVQTFDTVHQLISTIEAEVENDMDPVSILKNCFPMGSMTGAPKIEVMKAIDELENYKRGLYSGAIGYFSPDGDFDFNVVIRTAIINKNQLVYPVGGAITSDSIPEKEWEETEIKSRNITKVFQKELNQDE